MNRSGSDIDVVMDILKTMLKEKPEAEFINSLYKQYCERGGLSKKQMEGLHQIATKSNVVPPGKLATLEVIIKKRPTWDKKEPLPKPVAEVKDESILEVINDILEKFPQHKRVLFLKSKYEKNDPVSVAEIEELQRFKKILLK